MAGLNESPAVSVQSADTTSLPYGEVDPVETGNMQTKVTNGVALSSTDTGSNETEMLPNVAMDIVDEHNPQ